MDFKNELNDRVNLIEKEIKNNLINENYEPIEKQKIIVEAMNYSVLGGGKRLRPLLMQETSQLFGKAGNEIRYFMTAIELIHSYSLVHDDLPAMDDDDYRRGRKTTHVVYGEAMGILAGDALLNYAYEVGLEGVSKANDINRAVKALKILADKAGVFGMVGGQVADIEAVKKKVDLEQLDYINERKTGALIEASMMIGAVLAGATDEAVKQIETAASKIGRAFQIKDDILDVTSTSEVLGKPILSDEKNNKSTYVTLLGIDDAMDKVKKLSDEAMNELDKFENKNEFLIELIQNLISREK